jgi:arsenate reductase
MTASLGRRAVAEGVGTGLLVAVVVGSGIAADRLAPDAPAVVLLANSVATAGGLLALIAAFGAISGAHLNPVVTGAARLLGRISTREAFAYIAAQFGGGVAGVVVANTMFDLAPVALSTTQRSSGGLWLGETVATFGLVVVIFTIVAAGRASMVPYAVAGYIGAGYWFASSTSFVNPAVTVARTLTDTFTGIAPASVPAFLAAQVVGGLAAVGLVRYLYPALRSRPVTALDRPDAE